MQMNDPMEGHYFVKPGIISSGVKQIIKSKKESFGIVSLSTDAENLLMWAHYANGHNGIAIGVEIMDENCEMHKVKYKGLRELTEFNQDNPHEVAKNILTYKHDFWSCEEWKWFFRPLPLTCILYCEPSFNKIRYNTKAYS